MALQHGPTGLDTPLRPLAPGDDADEYLRYESSLLWTAEADGYDLDADAGVAFVEYRATTYDDSLGVAGTPAWWQATGVARLAKDRRQFLADDLRKPGTTWVAADMPGPFTARYLLALDDISTPDDRDHWIARGRMRLTDRRDGRIVAEYVGLSANQRPGYLRDEERFHQWENTLECPGPERRYADGQKRWQALRFFFDEVVQAR